MRYLLIALRFALLALTTYAFGVALLMWLVGLQLLAGPPLSKNVTLMAAILGTGLFFCLRYQVMRLTRVQMPVLRAGGR